MIKMGKKILSAVDIGGTKITVSLVDKEGILVKVYQNTKLKRDNKTIPKQVDFLIDCACERIRIKKQEISFVGIGTCGPFLKKKGNIVVVAPNLCGGLTKGKLPNDWTEIPLEEELKKIYNHLVIENDAVSAVVAERIFGAGKDENNLVYITWSTGIGGGAYVDGNLIKGKNSNAPHVGHIYIAEDGPECGCGNYGDFESLTSGNAISRDYGNHATTKQVFLEYKNKPRAKKVIDKAAKNFARGLASINAMFDTKVFVIGGSVYMNNKEILLPLVKSEFKKSFPALSNDVEIKSSVLDKYIGDIAALSLVMPKDWVKKWAKEKPWENAPLPIILE